jgi:hypothetical protein
MKQVSKEEFDNFIKRFPNCKKILHRICEPPLTTFTTNTSDKVIGQIKHDWLGPNGERVGPEEKQFWTYWIN